MTTGEWLLPVKTHRSLESIISISVKNVPLKNICRENKT